MGRPQDRRGALNPYRVLLTEEAGADLLRIEDLIIDRELASATPDPDVARCLREAVDHAARLLAFSPCSCRRATRARNERQREVIIPFGHAGLVAAFEVRGEGVWIGALRHPLEPDCP